MSQTATPSEGIKLNYRTLTVDDAPVYRDLRLHALDTEGKYFTADIQQERAFSIEEWAVVCAETTKHVVFGVFANDKLVGVVSADAIDNDHIKWRAGYIVPELRRAGLMVPLYVLREYWSVRKGYTSAEFTIRADNTRTRTIQESHGAILTGIKDIQFADGSIAPTCFYTKPLRRPQMEETIWYLSETLEHFGTAPNSASLGNIRNG